MPVPEATAPPPKVQRPKNGAKLRARVAERDGWACCWCRRELSPTDATLEHLVPLSRGGDNKMDNLQLACATCNHGRGDDVAPRLVVSDADRERQEWADRMEAKFKALNEAERNEAMARQQAARDRKVQREAAAERARNLTGPRWAPDPEPNGPGRKRYW